MCSSDLFRRIRDLSASAYLRSPEADGRMVLDAAERLASGDVDAAAALLRPLLGGQASVDGPLAWLMVTTFDRAGAKDLADRLDQSALAAGGEYNGVGMAHVRSARRHARNDPARARQLAQKVVDAWSTADSTPPVLLEMRKLASSGAR